MGKRKDSGKGFAITEADKTRLLARIRGLRARLEEAERALEAVGNGEAETALAHSEIPPPTGAPQHLDPLFRSIVDMMRAGVVTISNDNVILCCNDFFSGMVGIPGDSLVGSSFLDLLSVGDRKSFARFTGRGRIARSARELALRTVQGREIYLRLTAGCELGSSHNNSCIVVADISGLRAVEKALQAANDGLERRVKERTRDLQKALDELACRVEERTREVAEMNRVLLEEIRTRRSLEKSLDAKSRTIEEVNTALKVLLKQREEDRSELEENILVNLKDLILPYLGQLKRGRLNPEQASSIDILEANLDRIASPLVRKMKKFDLTPREIEVVSFLKDGRTTKQVAELLGITLRAIEFHRYNIRKKMGLSKTKANLRAYLLSLADGGD